VNSRVTGIPSEREAYISAPLPIERELRRLFPRLDAKVVFDIGSCEGEDAIRYASLFPSATVYAFEPVPDNVRLIEANLAKHPQARIRVMPVALSDSEGRATLFVSSGQPPGAVASDWDFGNKSSSLLRPDRHLDVHPWVHFESMIEVKTETLEGVCGREGISDIDLVHLDVQGAELSVLKGAGSLLGRIGAIWMEVEAVPLYEGQPLKSDVERFMTRHGFRRVLDTVDSVSGDQLYVNPRLLRPKPRRTSLSVRAWLRRQARKGQARSMGLALGIALRWLRPLMGRKRYQAAFTAMHRASLVGLNIGPADDLTRSGELRVLRMLSPRSTVLDVGANVGGYSAAAVARGLTVHAFEPSSDAFATLQASMSGRACLHQHGLGERDDTLTLYAPEPGSGMASVYARKHPVATWSPVETVSLRRLDDVALEEGIERIDLLKLDVEGHELAVLRGAARMLAEGRIKRVQFEFGGTNIDAGVFLRDILAELVGFTLYRIVRDGVVPVTYDERWEIFTTTNYLAVKS
jgi:FkbM family methyltransferase